MLQDAAKTNETPSPLPLPSLSSSLPSLDKPTLSVPKLVLKLNRPVRMPRNVDAWNRLQRISEIDVQPVHTSSNQEPQYVISVFLRHSQSRIPTVNNRANEATSLLGSLTADKPDLTVLRSFAELEALRAQVWESIRHPHPVYCELCDGLSLLMISKLSLPALFKMTIHRSQSSRAKKMRKFLLRVLSELQEHKAQCVPACKGQHDLPVMLHSFLFGDEENMETAEEAAGSTTQRNE